MTPKIARIGSPPKKNVRKFAQPAKNDTKIWQPPENRILPNLKPLKVPAYLNCDEGRNINKMPAYLKCDEGRNINMRSSQFLAGLNSNYF